MYRLRLLGAPSLEGPTGYVTGHAVQPRQMAVLAVVAATAEPGITRDKLTGLLWPEFPDDMARYALRDAIYLLRGTLGVLQDGVVDLPLAEPQVRVPHGRHFMGDGDLGMGVEQRADETVAASGVADELTVDLDAIEQTPMPEAADEEVRVVTGVAGLLACVAFADQDYAESEADKIREELGRIHGLPPSGVDAIAAALKRPPEIIVDPAGSGQPAWPRQPNRRERPWRRSGPRTTSPTSQGG